MGWGMDWIDLAWDTDRWLAVVIAVWIFGFQKMQGDAWLAEELLASREVLCAIKLIRYFVGYCIV